MNDNELLELWQSSEVDAPVAFTGRELAHHAPKHRVEGARLPPVSSDGATYLAATLEAHRSVSLRRLRLVEFVAAGRALERLRDLMGWSKPKSSWVPVLGVAGVALALVAVVSTVLFRKAEPPVLAPLPAPAGSEFVEACFSSVRAASTDLQWAQAESNCRRALELEPSNPAVAAKVARIPLMRGCANRYAAAVDDVERGALEHAFATLETIDRTCESYFFKAMALANQHVVEVTRGLAEDCVHEASEGAWARALQRCEAWARLACQRKPASALYPPDGLTLKLSGPLNPKTDWRPDDRVYVAFLKVRALELPEAAMWECPQMPLLRHQYGAPQPNYFEVTLRELEKRYPEPAFGLALVSYFKGDFASALVPLTQVEEQSSKASLHAQSKALRADIEKAVALYTQGTEALSKGLLESAESTFVEALAVDERLVLGDMATLDRAQRHHELGRRESFLRRNIQNTMSSSAYEKGRSLADRGDFRGACSKWKLGARFSRANIDLLKGLVNVCTKRAAEAFERARTCDELKAARDFAVDGDGFRQKIDESLAERGCAP